MHVDHGGKKNAGQDPLHNNMLISKIVASAWFEVGNAQKGATTSNAEMQKNNQKSV
jgi:hypothetical protein